MRFFNGPRRLGKNCFLELTNGTALVLHFGMTGDVGAYRDTGAPGKPWRALAPGMVLTVEPGIYVRPGAGVPEQFWHTGIRIEDDVLVTPQGHEVFSTAPKSVAEIEQLMSQD